ncbi:MAG TPA: acetyl-CoA carboxylase biotin carboxylase subunit [Herpetosiphonaceae bacterium]
MFSTVLIANRGEIALRVMRACKELGLRTVAVYSEADRDALHVRYADDAYLIGPPPATESYLQIETIISVARRAGAGAIHPGYGFLAENAHFARACREAGLVFIGPTPEAMDRMGGKVPARNEAIAADVPIVPGTTEPVETAHEVQRLGESFGYPIAIKASAGGGGRGLKVVTQPGEVQAAFESARREAAAYFKNDEVYVEKYITDPRHIEIQILGDTHGNVLYLGERDCSIQRRHQKLVEESPSPAITPDIRAAMGAAAVRLAQRVGYTGAGTLEFLFEDGQFYFLEMNTRIQVEHTVTEQVTGIDLVKWQIAVAQGARLPWTQDEIELRGHAIECRINAEDPADGFRPSLGLISEYREPHGFGVRVDSGYTEGVAIPQFYDSLVAKLVTWGQDRAEAIARMRRALDDFTIGGVRTTIPFHRQVMQHPAFERGAATVRFIGQHIAEADLKALAQPQGPVMADDGAATASSTRTFDVEVNGRRFQVRVAQPDLPAGASGNGASAAARPRRGAPAKKQAHAADPNAVLSPIQGTVVAVRAQPGMQVEAGHVLFVVEAMKMENEITAPRAGTIKEVRVAERAAVQAGETLATLE